mmetsp:Transcript_32074/g.95534  ORF Transcript_32074/g.95534 Transcript_32074/m.95534 type:complete len:246 (-) Transcript_32074:159-896(-)
MPWRVVAAEVLHGRGIGGRARGSTEFLLDDALGVWPLYTAHGIVYHAETRRGNHLLDLLEVKALLQQCQVVLHAVKDLDCLVVAEAVDDGHVQAKVREVLADLELCDLGCPLHHLVGHLLWCRTTVLAVVLDAKVVIRATGVVRGRANEAAERHETRASRANHRRGRRRGEEAVGAAPDVADAVGKRHLNDDLDRRAVPVSPIARNDQSAALNGDAEVLEGVEDALNVVVQVRILLEDLCLLAES